MPRTAEIAAPWREVPGLSPATATELRRRAVFECCKWDPQVGDVSVLAAFPLVLGRAEWTEVAHLAEGLAAEAMAAERELIGRTELHADLGLTRPMRRALAAAGRQGATAGAARFMRFDFHWTAEGWCLSEVNSDVPGGFNEASGFTKLVAACYPGYEATGDPTDALAAAIADAAGPGAAVGMIHATAYSDDRQVIEFLSRRLAARGLRPVELAPDHLQWDGGCAGTDLPWHRGELGLIFRFFPAEWLPELPRRCGWQCFYAGGRTPVANPGSAVLTQSKRFPLVWDRLQTELPLWRRLLPETVDPRRAPAGAGEGWVLKPAFGRVGESIGMAGVTAPGELALIARTARRQPSEWAAQRRFEIVPVSREGRQLYPCLGVYTVDGRTAGAYARVSPRRVIDGHSMEAAVLIASGDGEDPS
jgi:glutathionylspermidine synthase